MKEARLSPGSAVTYAVHQRQASTKYGLPQEVLDCFLVPCLDFNPSFEGFSWPWGRVWDTSKLFFNGLFHTVYLLDCIWR